MISLFYLALLILLYLVITFHVIGYRLTKRVAYGDGKVIELKRLRSAHDNFSAYTSLFCLLMFGVEFYKIVSPTVLHFLGVSYLLSRILHYCSLAFLEAHGIFKVRTLSMLITTSLMLGLATTIMLSFFS